MSSTCQCVFVLFCFVLISYMRATSRCIRDFCLLVRRDFGGQNGIHSLAFLKAAEIKTQAACDHSASLHQSPWGSQGHKFFAYLYLFPFEKFPINSVLLLVFCAE